MIERDKEIWKSRDLPREHESVWPPKTTYETAEEKRLRAELKEANEVNEAINKLSNVYFECLEKMLEAANQARKDLGEAVGYSEPVSLNEFSKECYEASKAKGWYDDANADDIVTKLCLVHSEISESLEEYRNNKGLTEIYYNPDNPNKPEGFPIEIADALIRIFDICGANGIDIENAVRLKMKYNKTRGHRHGGKKC